MPRPTPCEENRFLPAPSVPLLIKARAVSPSDGVRTALCPAQTDDPTRGVRRACQAFPPRAFRGDDRHIATEGREFLSTARLHDRLAGADVVADGRVRPGTAHPANSPIGPSVRPWHRRDGSRAMPSVATHGPGHRHKAACRPCGPPRSFPLRLFSTGAGRRHAVPAVRPALRDAFRCPARRATCRRTRNTGRTCLGGKRSSGTERWQRQLPRLHLCRLLRFPRPGNVARRSNRRRVSLTAQPPARFSGLRLTELSVP